MRARAPSSNVRARHQHTDTISLNLKFHLKVGDFFDTKIKSKTSVAAIRPTAIIAAAKLRLVNDTLDARIQDHGGLLNQHTRKVLFSKVLSNVTVLHGNDQIVATITRIVEQKVAKKKRPAQLRAGLQALGLSPRGGKCASVLIVKQHQLELTHASEDSRLQEEYVKEGGDLRHVLRTAAHMHYLHEHTNGRYRTELEMRVDIGKDYDGYFPGIYSVYGRQLQEEMPLPERLPWLQNQGNKSLDQLLTEAVEAARSI